MPAASARHAKLRADPSPRAGAKRHLPAARGTGLLHRYNLTEAVDIASRADRIFRHRNMAPTWPSIRFNAAKHPCIPGPQNLYQARARTALRNDPQRQ
jgi:hypothetical protein